MARIRWPRRRITPDRFFRDTLLGLSARLAAAGRSYFATGPDPAAPSYWEAREQTRMQRQDFEANAPRSPAQLEAALLELWTDSEDLAPLAHELQLLAEKLHRVDVDDPDVSAFVYVMY